MSLWLAFAAAAIAAIGCLVAFAVSRPPARESAELWAISHQREVVLFAGAIVALCGALLTGGALLHRYLA
jgi:hypothetical protein